MPVALSSQMAKNLSSLLDVNTAVGQTQNRLSTGKAVASASDNIAVYFRAKSFSDKADLLDTTNKNIDQAVQNLDALDKALSNMQDSVKGALDIAKSARSKAVSAAAKVTTNNTTGSALGPTGQAYAETGAGPTLLSGNIVGGAASSSTRFQAGDVFRADVYDSTSRTTQTRFFKAVTGTADPTKSGSSAADALEFTDLKSLADSLNKGFGTATANFNTSRDATGNWKLGFTLGDENKAITFGQTVNGLGGAPALAPDDANFDFSALFGKVGGTAAGSKSATISSALDLTGNASDAASYTFAPLAGASSTRDAIDTRKDAADFFRQTIAGMAAIVADSSLPGFANVLNGETLTVDLNETSTVQQTIKLAGGKIDFSLSTSSGSKWGVGFTQAGGVAETSLTANDDFKTNQKLDQAIGALNNIYSGLKQVQSALAASKVAMNSRLDYNKTVVGMLNQGATSMTAADTTLEAANLASLQNQQLFAAQNMSITKQAEQGLIQLLR